jgi:K+-sensing histidine kinase KdpD
LTVDGRERLWSVRCAAGAAAAVALTVALSLLLLPWRGDISVATTAVVLVVPVVVGVAVGGFPAGVVATTVGFPAYDFVFIPPYYTLTVGSAQDWTALGVYVVVMVVVSRVVDRVEAARADAQARAGELRRLFDVSDLLVRASWRRRCSKGSFGRRSIPTSCGPWRPEPGRQAVPGSDRWRW